MKMAPPCLLAPAPLTPSATLFLIALRAIRIVPNPFLCTTDTRSNRHKSRIFSTPSSNKRRTYTKVSCGQLAVASGGSRFTNLESPSCATRNTSRLDFPVTRTKQSRLIFLPETAPRIVAMSPALPPFLATSHSPGDPDRPGFGRLGWLPLATAFLEPLTSDLEPLTVDSNWFVFSANSISNRRSVPASALPSCFEPLTSDLEPLTVIEMNGNDMENLTWPSPLKIPLRAN
jgi:hypothetical protein